MDGQLDILDVLRIDDKAAKKLTRTQDDMVRLPEEVWRQNQTPDKSTDYWYHVLACTACGLPATRYGLNLDHSIQFDKITGQQLLPPGPGMRDHGVCGLMASTRDDAQWALAIEEGGPQRPSPGEWWRRCYLHEHQKKKCKDACWPDHHRHLIRMADRVWGIDRWRDADP